MRLKTRYFCEPPVWSPCQHCSFYLNPYAGGFHLFFLASSKEDLSSDCCCFPMKIQVFIDIVISFSPSLFVLAQYQSNVCCHENTCFCLLHFYKTLNVLTGLINMASVLFIRGSWLSGMYACLCMLIYTMVGSCRKILVRLLSFCNEKTFSFWHGSNTSKVFNLFKILKIEWKWYSNNHLAPQFKFHFIGCLLWRWRSRFFLTASHWDQDCLVGEDTQDLGYQ